MQLENGYDTLLKDRIMEWVDYDELLAAGGRYADLYHEITELD